MFVLVVIYVNMIKVLIIVQFLLSLVILGVMGDEFQCDKMS